MSTAPAYLDIKTAGNYEIWTINRSQARNAISVALLEQLEAELQRLHQAPTLKALILTGAGKEAFCAGADLKERRNMSKEQVLSFLDRFRRVNHLLEDAPFPVVAMINGAALGGGLELALACHLRIAAKHARLGLPEVSLAIIPGAGGTQRLAREIGLSRARQWILLSKIVSAQEALDVGLLFDVAVEEQLLTHTLKCLEPILEGSTTAQSAALEALRSEKHTWEAGLQAEHRAYLHTFESPDREEALKAFQEKRKPVYRT